MSVSGDLSAVDYPKASSSALACYKWLQGTAVGAGEFSGIERLSDVPGFWRVRRRRQNFAQVPRSRIPRSSAKRSSEKFATSKQRPPNSNVMATWHTDMPCSCLDTYAARENALASRGGVLTPFFLCPSTGRKLCSYDEAHLYVDGSCVVPACFGL